MTTRRRDQLTTNDVTEVREGRVRKVLSDGGGLYLNGKNPTPYWFLRYRSPQTRTVREYTLGKLPDMPALAMAREARDDIWTMVRAGKCPVAERELRKKGRLVVRDRQVLYTPEGMTLRTAVEKTIEHRAGTWKDGGKSSRDWNNSLERYVLRKFGDLPVAEFTTQHVVEVLRGDGDIWLNKPQIAKKLVGRLRQVIKLADARENRDRRNPASADALDPWLLKRRVEVTGHPGPAAREAVHAFARQTAGESISASAVAFLVYTAARVGAVVAARWRDIDLDDKEWRVPRSTLKASATTTSRGQVFTVPLSRQAVALLKRLGRPSTRLDLPVFPSPHAPWRPITGQALLTHVKALTPAFVPHGWRSTFATVATEDGWEHRDVVEVALDHTPRGGAVWGAYMRGELLERRRRLMQRWADFLNGGAAPAKGRSRRRGRSARGT